MSDKLTDNLRMNIGSKADPLEPEELNSNFMKIDESLKDQGVNVKWFGAVGDGITDDTAAFQAAMQACDKRYRLFIPAGDYLVRQTIENHSRGIFGVASYVDGAQAGSRIIWDPEDNEADLLPCIRIQDAGIHAVFEDFTVSGKTSYTPKNLANWVDKERFEQGLYEMFSPGPAGIEIAGRAQPIFRNIRTLGVKVGQLLNSTNGHIYSYDCNWGGLVGVYCRINSGDYLYQGGMITGAFCGILLGTILHAGHRGGIEVNLHRVHMGYAPYGIYQCIDGGLDDYNRAPSVLGLRGIFTNAQFEQCGEAAIKLLTKSLTSNLLMFGFGFSWSVLDYPPEHSGWAYPLPDTLKPREEKQQYAAWFGTVQAPVTISEHLGKLRRSSAPGARGTAFIDTLTGYQASDLSGLEMADVVIRRKVSSIYRNEDLHTRMMEREHRALMPVSAPNLLRNPEVLSNWTATNGASLSLVRADQVPVPISNEMKQILGSDPVILKVTPDGDRSPTVSIKFNADRLPYRGDAGRNLAMQYFILETEYETPPYYKTIGRISGENHEYIFNDASSWQNKEWKHQRGREIASKTGLLYDFSIGFIPKSGDTYIAGVMVTWDHIGSYSPYPHSYMTSSLEIGGQGSGVILTDSVTQERYLLSMANGNIQITKMN
ncbi:glycosyl hydrolase family 28-related protein [Paenibacillus cisolokensis]|uniref:glycosyl hydrolase family 28-related protein n=1 Tax=Paenibacillus cisolokensis TaxID=1658519 RepID=UPI003D2E5330